MSDKGQGARKEALEQFKKAKKIGLARVKGQGPVAT